MGRAIPYRRQTQKGPSEQFELGLASCRLQLGQQTGYPYIILTICTLQWQRISGGLKWIGSGTDIVVGVNSQDKIYYRRGVSSSNPTGSGWVYVSGRLMQIDVDGDQAVGVNSGHNIYLSDVTSGLLL